MELLPRRVAEQFAEPALVLRGGEGRLERAMDRRVVERAGVSLLH